MYVFSCVASHAGAKPKTFHARRTSPPPNEQPHLLQKVSEPAQSPEAPERKIDATLAVAFHDLAAKTETTCTPPSPTNHEDDDDDDDDADESDDDDDNDDDDSDEGDDEGDADDDDDYVNQADDDDHGDDGDDDDADNREDEEDDDDGACYDGQVDDDEDDDDDTIGVQPCPCKASNSRVRKSQVSPLDRQTQINASSRLPCN